MADRLGPVRLFGKTYQWHRAPGQPLELHAAPPPLELRPLTPAELYEETMRMMGGLLPWGDEDETSA